MTDIRQERRLQVLESFAHKLKIDPIIVKTHINSLGLTTTVRNKLLRNNICYIGDIVSRIERDFS